MKLIIKQYLASLKERNELDALLPDLLSQMGLTVFSTPGRGTRQDGVDVAAVGSLEGDDVEKVYLFSIKAGNLTRKSWNNDGLQSLRPSLDEIKDSYIPTRLPKEHKGKPIVICLCFGGEMQEQVRTSIEGYIDQNTTDQISYEEWNGDKLAELILQYFLREDLLPKDSRPLLRKSLAMLDEPEASFTYFSQLLDKLLEASINEPKKKLMYLRQMSICLWIIFSWARDHGNLESAYLASERTLLLFWELAKNDIGKQSKNAKAITETFQSILYVYYLITSEYVKKIAPYVGIWEGLSIAVQPSSSLDVNLKLFDLLGRLAIYGLWNIHEASIVNDENKNLYQTQITNLANIIKTLISNNPILLLPIKDDQAIDVFLTILFLTHSGNNANDIKLWIDEIVERARFAYETDGQYPCILRSYYELLEHPQKNDNYREEVTQGSILYPYLALWSAIFGFEEIYKKISDFKKELLKHCNFQIWYPGNTTEENLYTNKNLHGITFSDVPVEQPSKKFLEILWNECDQTEYFQKLSVIEKGYWPLVLLACRHYRIPVPVHFTLKYRK